MVLPFRRSSSCVFLEVEDRSTDESIAWSGRSDIFSSSSLDDSDRFSTEWSPCSDTFLSSSLDNSDGFSAELPACSSSSEASEGSSSWLLSSKNCFRVIRTPSYLGSEMLSCNFFRNVLGLEGIKHHENSIVKVVLTPRLGNALSLQKGLRQAHFQSRQVEYLRYQNLKWR